MDTSSSLPWDMAPTITAFRKESGLTLRQLSDSTREADPLSRGVQPAQISRFENGTATPDAREIYLLAHALNKSPEKFLPGVAMPWFLVRFDAAMRRLDEVRAGTRIVERRGDSHETMIKRGVYRYVPIDEKPGLVKEGESAGILAHYMQKYLFEVGRCDEALMLEGLLGHAGEEIVFVLRGELEFWTRQYEGQEPKRITLRQHDSLHYSSVVPHGYRATGIDDTALAYFVYTLVGSPPPDEIQNQLKVALGKNDSKTDVGGIS
jgi:transcriptional regulator with XRE-family HTH domain